MHRLIFIVLLTTAMVISLAQQINAGNSKSDFKYSSTSSTSSLSVEAYALDFNASVSSGNSSGSLTNATLQQVVNDTEHKLIVAEAIYRYGLPVLVTSATVGNTISIFVFQHPAFRKSSTSFILSTLALVDMVYVDFSATYQWFTLFGKDYDITLKSSSSCKFTTFMYFFPRMVSY